MFGGEICHNASKLTCLYKVLFTDWAKATVRFHDHGLKSEIHKNATLKATHFREYMENRRTSIDVVMNSQINQQVRINRAKLIPIVEAIVMCGRQNIPLRGHRDDLQYCNLTSNNPGNLQAILAYMKKCGKNEVFNQHYFAAPRKATYRSKATQNELIRICGELISTNW